MTMGLPNILVDATMVASLPSNVTYHGTFTGAVLSQVIAQMKYLGVRQVRHATKTILLAKNCTTKPFWSKLLRVLEQLPKTNEYAMYTIPFDCEQVGKIKNKKFNINCMSA